MSGSPRQPVIVIGMHRSGTSMVVRMLERLGLFFGRRQEHNAEALFFLRANEWLMSQCGGSWDNPQGALLAGQDDRFRELACQYLRDMLGSVHAASFLGLGGWARHRSVMNLDIPWGWKDPRNTFTLGVWLKLFPQARVVHVLRNGIDVAASLQTRLGKDLERATAQLSRRRALRCLLRPFGARITNTLRCGSLRGGFELWQQYVRQGREAASALGDRAVEVRFEDLLAQPGEHLRRLAVLAGIEPSEAQFASAAALAKGDRANAFKRRPELEQFAASVAPELAQFGYGLSGGGHSG